jgi:hypothetical protein
MGQIYGSGVVDTEHPAIVDAINNMIDRGYSKEKIVQITGAPSEVVESHQRHKFGTRSPEYDPRSNDELEKKRAEMRERMAKARAARKPKEA